MTRTIRGPRSLSTPVVSIQRKEEMFIRHTLWTMDGRTWIEAGPVDHRSTAYQHAHKMGWVRIIPDSFISDLIRKMDEEKVVA